MVASTIDGRPRRGGPIQGWGRRSRSLAGPIQGLVSYPAPAFYAELIDSLVPRKATGSATFTRATTAYVEDFEGLLKPVISGEARFTGARRVYNMVSTKSEDLTNAAWVVSGATKISATVLQFNAQFDYIRQIALPLLAGRTYRISFDCRVISGNTALAVWHETSATGDSTNFTATATTQRYSVTCLGGAGGTVNVGIIDLNAAGHGQIYYSRIQVEDVTGQTITAPSEYVSVGVLSTPWHGCGVDGVKCFRYQNGNTVASNVVTEATGAAIADATLKGYLAEGARTNRCLYSSTFENAAWVSGGGGITADDDSAVSPTGATNAATLTAAGANGTLIQDLGVVASAAKTGSLYLKRKTGSGDIDITMDGGATWTTVAVTSSWVKFEKTQTLANEDFGIRIVTSGDAVYAWNGQVENGSKATSAIPTTTVAVARNGDQLTWPSTGNVSGNAGTAYCEFIPENVQVGENQTIGANVSDGSAANRWLIVARNTDAKSLVRLTKASATQASIDGTGPAAAFVAGTTYKVITRFAPNNYKAWINGVVELTDTSVSVGITFTTIYIGLISTGAGTEQAYGNTKNVRIWTSALSDAQVQGL